MTDESAHHQEGNIVTCLRDPFWTDEAPGLYRAQTCPGQSVDELDFEVDRYGPFLVLQPISRSDFDDVNGVVHPGEQSAI